MTPDKLLHLIQTGDVEAVEPVLAASSEVLNRTTPEGYTWLHQAAMSNQAEMIRLLVRLGIPLRKEDAKGHEPIWHAFDKDGVDAVRTFLDLGIEPDAAPSGQPLLILALFSRFDHELMRMLLERGANPNVFNKAGSTPLMKAVRLREEACVAVLLEYGADPRLCRPGRISALDSALSSTADGGRMADFIRGWENAHQALRAIRAVEDCDLGRGLAPLAFTRPAPMGPKP